MPSSRRRLLTGLLGAVLAAAAGPARAEDDTDPWGVLPPDQSRFHRSGFALGVGLGPAVFLGTGSQSDFGGIGGTLRVRLGTSASRDLLWFTEAAGGSYLEEVPADTRGMDGMSDAEAKDLARSEEVTLTFGAQWFFGEAFFVRGGLGFATSTRRTRSEPDTDLLVEKRRGLATVGAIGADVYRRKSFTVDLEFAVNSDLYPGGYLGRWQLAAAFNWY